MTVLGYCIGGALATCFAALHPEATRNLVLLTAPLDFSDAGQFGRMTARGVFPIERSPTRSRQSRGSCRTSGRSCSTRWQATSAPTANFGTSWASRTSTFRAGRRCTGG